MSLVEAVRRANRPGAAEHSVALRVASTGAVVVAIGACWSQGELSPWVAVGAMALTVAGNVFSYRHRERPPAWLKLVLAALVVGAFVWFFATVTAGTAVGNLGRVLGPLATLFTGIQVTHAFDVPSRRDLAFSLAGSATLMAVAAAEAVDTTFGIYVVAWALLGLAGLRATWASMAGGTRLSRAKTAGAGVAVAAVGLALVAVLPPPHAASNLIFPAALGGGVPLGPTGSLVGGGPDGSQPVRAGSPGGPARVGGFLGFAQPLDTAIRGNLGDQVVMRVRADRPSFWLAETFDRWDGSSWTETSGEAVPWRTLRPADGTAFSIPAPTDEPGGGPTDLQTFYLAVAGPNLVFHAPDAVRVWSPSNRLFISPDGTIRSGSSMGKGTVYTVESAVAAAPPAALDTVGIDQARSDASQVAPRYLELPHAYPSVQALAERVTAHDRTLYGAVRSLEAWIARHTRYTTDIPPLRPGQDSVTQFLFGNRRGYCEQISTALAVMLRTIGIPTREATGYVPGSFNPITDLYQVQAKDAHAWVQVWFPRLGWQSFDPTASVPLANPSPARALAHDVVGALHRVPVLPTVLVAAGAALAAVAWRRHRRRPTWTRAVSADLVAAARRAGLRISPDETLAQLAERLDRRLTLAGRAPPRPSATDLANGAEAAAFGAVEVDRATRRAWQRSARRLRRLAWRARRTGTSHDNGNGNGTRNGAGAGNDNGPLRSAPAPEPRPSSRPLPAGLGRTSGHAGG